MNIEITANVPNDTYSRTEEHAPIADGNTLTILNGRGSSRSWGTPGTTSTIVLNDDDFAAIHIGFHHKHGGGQFWRYFTTDGAQITQIEWRHIPDEQRARILEAYQTTAPKWAKSPGKLRENYVKPSSKSRTTYKLVERRVDGSLVSLFDGDTVYTLGKRLTEKAAGDPEWNTHRGGFYSYPTQEQVLRMWNAGNLVPAECYTPGMTVVMLECDISGTLITYANGKIASTYLTPRAILDTFVYAPMEQAA